MITSQLRTLFASFALMCPLLSQPMAQPSSPSSYKYYSALGCSFIAGCVGLRCAQEIYNYWHPWHPLRQITPTVASPLSKIKEKSTTDAFIPNRVMDGVAGSEEPVLANERHPVTLPPRTFLAAFLTPGPIQKPSKHSSVGGFDTPETGIVDVETGKLYLCSPNNPILPSAKTTHDTWHYPRFGNGYDQQWWDNYSVSKKDYTINWVNLKLKKSEE